MTRDRLATGRCSTRRACGARTGLRERQGRRSAARSAALRARGLRSTSAEAARSGRRVRTRRPARCPQTQVGRWGGQMQSRDSRREELFDDPILERLERDHDDASAGSEDAHGRRQRLLEFASSSLTAMRRAWKTRVAGSMPRGLRVFTPATKRPRSSAAPNGVLTRRRTIAPATARRLRLLAVLGEDTSKVLLSPAVHDIGRRLAKIGSERMSSRPRERKLKARSSSASWMDESPSRGGRHRPERTRARRPIRPEPRNCLERGRLDRRARQLSRGDGERCGIAIESEELSVGRACVEDGGGVPAPTDRPSR